ncbi:MAG: hypothetical protein ACYSVY_10565, partial [Planctomycetota bacterium]
MNQRRMMMWPTLLASAVLVLGPAVGVLGQPVPGGSLDPPTNPKGGSVDPTTTPGEESPNLAPKMGPFVQPAPDGPLDSRTIPKYVIPLVIPPVMNNDGAADSYDIAVREFKQQILPGGIWNSLNGRND